MSSVNRVILIGRCSRDPEKKQLADTFVTKFSIATSEKFTDKSGNKTETTEWHKIEAWGKSAEIIEKYVKKGTQIYIEGSLKTESWETPDGVKKSAVKIKLSSFTLLSSPKNDEPKNDEPYENKAIEMEEDLPF